MNFGTRIVEVIDWLHAKFQHPTLSLTRDFEIGSRVGRASREIRAFWLDHFFPRYPFYSDSCPIQMELSTNIVEVID